MQVLLLKDVKGLGKRGDVKEVAEGYGRNFLIPKGLVTPATKGNVNMLEHEAQLKKDKEAHLLKAAQDLAAKLENVVVVVDAKAGEGGKLFGSVTNADVAGSLEKIGFEIEKRKIEFNDVIKTLGNHHAVVRLHPKVQVNINILVQAL